MKGERMKSSIVVKEELLAAPDFRWVSLKKIFWQDPAGKDRLWEAAFRPTRRSECDGVAVMGVVRYPKTGKPAELLLVSQFRPPCPDGDMIEAPAGLVDAGESASEAAVRELKEETGYSGTVVSQSPITPCDPGMTNANMRYVAMDIDGDAPENVNAVATPEEGELITVHRLPLRSLRESLDRLSQEQGFQIDARLYAYALGLGVSDKEERHGSHLFAAFGLVILGTGLGMALSVLGKGGRAR